MKILGYLFILVGAFISIIGFTFYVSDIQLGIAFTGLNTVGIGILQIAVANLHSKSEGTK